MEKKNITCHLCNKEIKNLTEFHEHLYSNKHKNVGIIENITMALTMKCSKYKERMLTAQDMMYHHHYCEEG
jgi:hypothetical protein